MESEMTLSSNYLDCSEEAEAALAVIRSIMEFQSETGYTPFGNTGEKFKNNVFEVNAYDWHECNCFNECTCGFTQQEYNFKWNDFEVSWYKYFGRGMTMNKPISKERLNQLLIECVTSILTQVKIQKNNEK